MHVLVLGGTGFIGTALCAALDDDGHDVTALSRTPSDDLPADVAFVPGDVTDPDSIQGAFEGVDAAVFLPALSPLFTPRGGNQRHFRVHRDGTAHSVRAAEDHGVARFVQMSAIHAAPDADTAYLRAKGEAETLVRDADLDHVIIRPTTVYGEGGEFSRFVKRVAPPYVTPLPGGGRTRFQVIWLGDFVRALVNAITDAAHVDETYEIGGPDVLSLAEVARLLHAADGRPVTVIPIPMAIARVGMTIGGAIPGFPFGPDQYRSLQMDLVVEHNDIEAFGLSADDLTRFKDYLDSTPPRRVPGGGRPSDDG